MSDRGKKRVRRVCRVGLMLTAVLVSLLLWHMGEFAVTRSTIPTLLASALADRLDMGRIVILGQPSPADLARLRDEGVTALVNVRTSGEMESLLPAFDEEKLAQELGLAYHHAPVGGSSGWSADAVDVLASTVQATKGKVLLHCASGGRAGMVHAAYRIKYHHVAPMEAMRAVSPTGAWPHPIEQLSGVPLVIERSDSVEAATTTP